MRKGLKFRVWRALELFIHSAAKPLLPYSPSPSPPLTPSSLFGELLSPLHYCSTWPRVSGSLRARKLPSASAPEAKRMGTALVIPTKEVKMLIPKTAANLQRALRNPNAVVLRREGTDRSAESCSMSVSKRRKSSVNAATKVFNLFIQTTVLFEIDQLFQRSVYFAKSCRDHKGPQGGAT